VENETVMFNTSHMFRISRRKKMLVVKISVFYSDTMYDDKVSIKLHDHHLVNKEEKPESLTEIFRPQYVQS
jgi:hypothetical protein